jgi:signal transduction histidine kinase/DNA-binding NarL/FixJ family response regulator
MIRVAVVDDHPHVAIALRALLEETADIRLVAEAGRGSEVFALVQKARPHVLLLDLLLEPQFDALSAVRDLRVSFPHLRICLLSAHIEPSYVRDLLEAGVCGYILKDDDYVSRIESIIRDLAGGRLYLSPQAYEALAQATQQAADRELLTERERDILRLAKRGLPRSPNPCTSRPARCAITSAPSTANWACTAATRRCPSQRSGTCFSINARREVVAGPVPWILLGALGALLAAWIVVLARRWYHRWRYGLPIAHQDLLVQYGRRMAALMDREALARLLAVEVPGALDVSRAMVLLVEGHDLVAMEDSSQTGAPGASLRLPVLHAAVRRVASGGEAKQVGGRLQELIDQGSTDLAWTAVWVPLMRGTELYGLWLLGERAKKHAYAPEDLRWLTTLARQAAVVLETIRYAEQEQLVANEMQALYRQAVSARESERERLSRELHDGVLQDLCAVARDLKALEAHSEDGTPFVALITQSNESVQTLRAICHDLRPPLLSNNPALALKALVERLDAQSPAPIHIDISAQDLCVSEEMALAIYRIAQEAMHNAIQHADASEIAIRLTQYPDKLRMTITDDGRGIPDGTDLRRFVAGGHFGLAGMRERAAMIGGTLDVQSAPDYGTAVILEVPCE